MPPPVARWLLEYALPADVRESVTGDLDEVFHRDCQRYGLPGARRRYWRQTMSFTLHFVVERWRDDREPEREQAALTAVQERQAELHRAWEQLLGRFAQVVLAG